MASYQLLWHRFNCFSQHPLVNVLGALKPLCCPSDYTVHHTMGISALGITCHAASLNRPQFGRVLPRQSPALVANTSNLHARRLVPALPANYSLACAAGWVTIEFVQWILRDQTTAPLPSPQRCRTALGPLTSVNRVSTLSHLGGESGRRVHMSLNPARNIIR